jgi:plasmid stabilization system protein ParE
LKKLRISDEASAYLRAERAYIARFDKRAASAMILQLRQVMEMLRRFPQAGKALDVPQGVRRFSAPPYVIDYEVVDGVLGILIVRHARQNDPDIAADTRDDFEDF